MVLESVSCGRGVWWIFVQFKGGFGIFKGVGVEFGAVKFRGSGVRGLGSLMVGFPLHRRLTPCSLHSCLQP